MPQFRKSINEFLILNLFVTLVGRLLLSPSRTLITFYFSIVSAITTGQKLVHYDLHITDTTVNYTGKPRKAIAINGRIPGPCLEFTEGDTAEIVVHNHLHHKTSVHWHGLILPNEHDGVPYLTTSPILPHKSHTYKFALKQSGTYWYHSHTMLQEQVGMYGAFVIYKKNENRDKQHVMLLSDWTDARPEEIERSLHTANDWYAIKKGAAQSYWESITSGFFKTRFVNELKRMRAMDVSDVYYERFLVNGKVIEEKNIQSGKEIRLRIINGSASTYFWITYGGGKITVVASDGEDVAPVTVDRLIVGVSETYDIIVKLPDNGRSYAVVASAEDRTGNTKLWLGDGEKVQTDSLKRLDYFAGMRMMNAMSDLNGEMKHNNMKMGLQKMDMNAVMYPELQNVPAPTDEHSHHGHGHSQKLITLNYSMLRAPEKTTLPPAPVNTISMTLTGNMNRYVWSVDDRVLSEADKLLIRKGEITRIIITNNSMMRHPMHLHGHFFRVLNGQGEYAPLKNVLDVLPMETDTIEFYNSESGDWFFHCHILYHMMSGMGRIFSYENSPPNPQVPSPEKALKKVYADDRRFFLAAEVGLESNGSDGEIEAENTRWMLRAEWRLGLNDQRGYETESHLGRYLDKNQYLLAYTGWDYHYQQTEVHGKNLFGQLNTSNRRQSWCLGLVYTLPWLIDADFRVDHTGNIRMEFVRKDIPLSARLRGWALFNTDFEFAGGMKYILTKYLALSANYDSDRGWGAGVTVIY